jgi:hypothetical protein
VGRCSRLLLDFDTTPASQHSGTSGLPQPGPGYAFPRMSYCTDPGKNGPIRKYLAPALAEGLQPSPEVFDEQLWRRLRLTWLDSLAVEDQTLLLEPPRRVRRLSGVRAQPAAGLRC